MARQRTPEELAKMAANAQKVKAQADAAFTITMDRGPMYKSGDYDIEVMIMYCPRCGTASSISGNDVKNSKELLKTFSQNHEHILPSR
jgi:hypothetical protein